MTTRRFLTIPPDALLKSWAGFSTSAVCGSPYNRGGPRQSRRASKKAIRAKHSLALTHAPPNMVQPHAMFQPKEAQKLLYPREIVDYLNKFVIGQSIAKRSLAVAVYQHYRRVEHNNKVIEQWFLRDAILASQEIRKANLEKLEPDDFSNITRKTQRQALKEIEDREEILMEKANMILLGPSGSGKTFLTQKLADVLDVPMVICDCTTLTQAGYVGDDVDSVVQKLLQTAAGDVDRCQRGIIFLDEFDKIYTSSDPMHTSGNRDVSGKGVQQALLKLVEGTVVKVKDPLAPNQKVEIDTTNILFVASGAFSNLERIVARRKDQRRLGFEKAGDGAKSRELLNDDDLTTAAKAKDDMLKQCDAGDLIEFGMIPELVGRFPVLVPFHSLDQSQLRSVLSEPKGNLVAQSKKFFQMENIELRFSECALDEISKEASQRKTGARALKGIVERSLLDAKYDAPGSDLKCVEVTAETVKGEEYKIVEKREMKKKD